IISMSYLFLSCTEEKYNHNLNMVANIFGISRTTLWRYRQKHKL
ncbi:helix-turn-helix domain-containing protein, partial [Acinetobacter baumannii]